MQFTFVCDLVALLNLLIRYIRGFFIFQFFSQFLVIFNVDNHIIFKQYSYISSFTICISFASFSCFNKVTKLPLFKTVKEGILALFPILGNMYSVFHYYYGGGCRFMLILYQTEVFPFYFQLAENGCWVCPMFFLNQLKEHLSFLCQLDDVEGYLSFAMLSHIWNKPHLVIMKHNGFNKNIFKIILGGSEVISNGHQTYYFTTVLCSHKIVRAFIFIYSIKIIYLCNIFPYTTLA